MTTLPGVALRINGADYTGWTEVTVNRSMGEAASSFSLELTEIAEGLASFSAWRIRPGDACEVYYGPTLVLTGYVNVWSPTFDATSHRISAQGRSKTQDLVDSSATHPGGELRDYRIDAILRTFADEHGVEVVVGANVGRKFDVVRILQGETRFEVVERLARQRGLLLTDDAEGRAVLTRADQMAAAVASLVEGVNIKAGGATFRDDQRHSEYTVKGQRPGTEAAYGHEAAARRAEVSDENVKRFRPLIVLAEGAADPETMVERADWEATRRAGEAVSAQISVVGWEYAPGSLWTPGEAVAVTSPALNLDRTMVINSASYRQGAAGTTTDLELVTPESLSPDPMAEGGSGPAGSGSVGSGQAAEDIWTTTKPGQGAKAR